MSDEDLIRHFEAGTMPEGGFHHEQHVRVAWNYVTRYALPEALRLFVSGLKRFATAQGSPKRYHETITIAFVLLMTAVLSAPLAGDGRTRRIGMAQNPRNS